MTPGLAPPARGARSPSLITAGIRGAAVFPVREGGGRRGGGPEEERVGGAHVRMPRARRARSG